MAPPRLHPVQGRRLVLALAATLAGCGDAGGTGPSAGTLSVVPRAELVAEVGGERLFQARFDDGSGSPSLVRSATWTSSDPGVAVPLGGGRYRAMDAGTTTVAAAFEGLRASATLEVYLAPPIDAWEEGRSHPGRRGYVRYVPGTLPLVLSAGHGGREEPEEMADRSYGVFATDRNTAELLEAVAEALTERLGAAPHQVVSTLRRTKLDPNRAVEEAAQSDPFAEQAWAEYHAFLDTARALVTRRHGAGLYLDIHGHGHPVDRVELGYLLAADELALSDEALNAVRYLDGSSVRALVETTGGTLSEVVRGEASLGALLQDRGVRAVPSPAEPNPSGEPYFSGGYSTRRHGSRDGGTVSGIQLEHHFPGLRDTEVNREAYAAALASAVEAYLRRWYPGLLPGE